MHRDSCVDFGVNCLFVFLLYFITHLLSSLLSSFLMLSFLLIYSLTWLLPDFLSTPPRIDPFHFQAGSRGRRQNLALVFFFGGGCILCCGIFCCGCMFAFVVFDLVFQYCAKTLAGKNVSEITYFYFVSGGT